MRDCRDVIILAKLGYIYVVTNGGKNGSGKKEAGRAGRRKDRGGKRGAAERQRREEGPTERQRRKEGAGAGKTEPPPSNLAMYPRRKDGTTLLNKNTRQQLYKLNLN